MSNIIDRDADLSICQAADELERLRAENARKSAQSTRQWEAGMGKWEVIYDHGWHVVDVTDKSPGGQILICDCGIDPWSEMNALKIAAAPELAEALKLWARWDEMTEAELALALETTTAALAKAGVL